MYSVKAQGRYLGWPLHCSLYFLSVLLYSYPLRYAKEKEGHARARGPGFAFLSLEAHTAAGSRGVPQQAWHATAAAANLCDGEGGGGGVGSGRGRNITTS